MAEFEEEYEEEYDENAEAEGVEDPELLEIQKRLHEKESEYEKLNLMHKQVEKQINSSNLDEASV